VSGYTDPDVRAVRQAQAGYYNQRGEAAAQNAETRRLKAYGDIVDRIGPNPDQATFDRENQEGGLIHAAFGRPMDRREWGRAYQHAQARRGAGPTEQDALDAGIDPEVVKNLRQQNVITKMVGKAPEKGHMWAIDEKGNVTQKRVSQTGKALTDAEKALAVGAYENFNRAMDVLIGPINKETGKRDTSKGQSSPSLGVAQTPYVGKWLNNKGFNALNDAEAAAMDLSYFLSGKQIGNQEQLRLIKQYVPVASDPVETRQNKMERGMRFFRRMRDISQKGGDVMDYIMNELEKEEAEAAKRDPRAQGNEAGGRSSGRGNDGWGFKTLD